MDKLTKMKLGSIPKNVTYFIRPLEKRTTHWDDIDEEMTSALARPTFVSDADNKKTLQTGQEWAIGWGKKDIDYERLTRPNEPLQSVQIIGLEIRDKGGRAYKVLVDGIYFVDLREDVLLETMLLNGVEKGGRLVGQYIWARVNSEMKLVRVGSKLHEKMIESTTFNEQAAIPESELEVGRIYLNKKGDMYVYFGKLWVNSIKTKSEHSRFTCGYDSFIESIGPREQMLAFGRVWQYRLDRGNALYEDKEPSVYELHCIRKHSFKIASERKIRIPDTYIEDVKNAIRWTEYKGKRYSLKRQIRTAVEMATTFSASPDKDYVHPLHVGLEIGQNLGNSYSD